MNRGTPAFGQMSAASFGTKGAVPVTIDATGTTAVTDTPRVDRVVIAGLPRRPVPRQSGWSVGQK